MNTTSVKIDMSSMRPRSEKLAAVERELAKYKLQLAWAVDALIPADRALKMPSASEAGVLDKHLADALLLRDDLAADFFSAVAALPTEPTAGGMETLEAMDGKQFDVFTRLVAGAFFLNQKVNDVLRYPAQTAIFETPDYDFVIDSIAPVIRRGEIFTKI